MLFRFFRCPGFGQTLRQFLFAGGLLAVFTVSAASRVSARACVWKVTDPTGHTLYLAGSIHSLRESDYPLPASYEQAYAASSAVAHEFESSSNGQQPIEAWMADASYPDNGKLKDHIDPRTYAYILRVIKNARGSAEPEKQIEHLRAWAVALMLESPGGLRGGQSSVGRGIALSPKSISRPQEDCRSGEFQGARRGLQQDERHR